VVAPLAVNDVLAPEHIEGEAGLILTAGEVFTVTVTLAVPVHPPVVPVTV